MARNRALFRASDVLNRLRESARGARGARGARARGGEGRGERGEGGGGGDERGAVGGFADLIKKGRWERNASAGPLTL
jgi:hypothetical protein